MLSLRTITLPMYDNAGRPLQASAEAFANALISFAGGFTASEQWGEWREGPGAPIQSEAVTVYTVGLPHSASRGQAANAWNALLRRAWELYPDQKAIFVTGPAGAELLSRPHDLRSERVYDAMDGETHYDDGAGGVLHPIAPPHHTCLTDYDDDAMTERLEARTTLDDIKAVLPPRACPECGAARYDTLPRDGTASDFDADTVALLEASAGNGTPVKRRWGLRGWSGGDAPDGMDNLHETGNPSLEALEAAWREHDVVEALAAKEAKAV